MTRYLLGFLLGFWTCGLFLLFQPIESRVIFLYGDMQLKPIADYKTNLWEEFFGDKYKFATRTIVVSEVKD